jgi:pimeloyl-ACP methyl ester carboxylesterase
MKTLQHPMPLEVISREPALPLASPLASRALPPLLFVHGACAGAWCWDEHFLPYYAEHGFSAHALSLRGHGEGRQNGNPSASFSIENYVEDVRRVASELTATHGTAPVLVGHSMGGLVVQRYLEHGSASHLASHLASHPASGAVLMASYPATGILGSWLYWQAQMPFLWAAFAEFSRRYAGQGLENRAAFTHTWVFSREMDATLVEGYSRRFVVESLRAFMDMGVAVPNVRKIKQRMASEHLPMLVMGAANDAIFPAFEVENTARAYGVKARIFPQMAHGMMMETNWLEPASHLRLWLEQKFAP